MRTCIYRIFVSACVAALVLGCATRGHTGAPRIMEVTRTTYKKNVPVDQQREEFYVVWTGDNITQVKFEYRQVNRPNEVFARSYVPTKRRWYVFELRGAEFEEGGKVSAWRVSLWRDNQMLAEQKSALW